jgi:hypothetical protein
MSSLVDQEVVAQRVWLLREDAVLVCPTLAPSTRKPTTSTVILGQ